MESCCTTGIYLDPVRRPLSADDEFFDDGNVQRAVLCKISVAAFCDEIPGAEAKRMGVLENAQSAYECTFQGCTARFSSLKRQEEHYETSHRNHCATCGWSFPTLRLLDLHLSEAHDSFFKAMAERKAMFSCLVEGCSEVFWSPGERKGHLVDAHRYPKSFHFGRSSQPKRATRTTITIKIKCTGANGKGGDNASKPDLTSKKKPRRTRNKKKDAAGGGATAAAAAATAAESTPQAKTLGIETDCMSDGDPVGSTAAASASEARPPAECSDQALAATNLLSTGRPLDDGLRATGGENSGAKGVTAAMEFGLSSGFAASVEVDGGGEMRGSGGDRVGAVVGAGEGGVLSSGMDVSGVDELVDGFSKLLIPRHLSFGTSARRGTPMGSVRK